METERRTARRRHMIEAILFVCNCGIHFYKHRRKQEKIMTSHLHNCLTVHFKVQLAIGHLRILTYLLKQN